MKIIIESFFIIICFTISSCSLEKKEKTINKIDGNNGYLQLDGYSTSQNCTYYLIGFTNSDGERQFPTDAIVDPNTDPKLIEQIRSSTYSEVIYKETDYDITTSCDPKLSNYIKKAYTIKMILKDYKLSPKAME